MYIIESYYFNRVEQSARARLKIDLSVVILLRSDQRFAAVCGLAPSLSDVCLACDHCLSHTCDISAAHIL